MRFLLVLCIFSVFPLLSSAKKPVVKAFPKNNNKVSSFQGSTQNQGFLRKFFPGSFMGKCNNNCMKLIAQILRAKDKRFLSEAAFPEQHNAFIGKVLGRLPSMKARFQEGGITETEAFISAIVVAAAQSVDWNAAGRNNILELTKSLIDNGPNDHLEQIKNVERACPL